MKETTSSTKSQRVLSIDIMRGLTLFLMLFVNDLFVPGAPKWMVHTPADFDGMGLADWVFPGFLFMVGLSVPFAFASRLKKGDSKAQLLGHILVRTISLLIIGVLMLNAGRINSELTGMNRFVWAILMYLCVFLIWNKYPLNPNYKKLFMGLKALGVLGLVALVAIYRSGEPGQVEWLTTGWWGILGLIGWGYFAASVTFLIVGERMLGIVAGWLLFFALNVLSQLQLLGGLDVIKPVFGVLLSGSTPSIVMAGLVVGLLLKQQGKNKQRFLMILVLMGIASLVAGLVLRQWFIISKVQATPSWGMFCNGISMLLFALLYLVLDVWKKQQWSRVFLPAGQNSLTTYLAPDILYYLIWGLSLPILFYKQEDSQLLVVAGSLVWAFAMVGFAALLARINIRLKL